ncbi:ABC transporter ATP-binding protein [Thalassoglobus polymorphus]|uniref:Lipoprotein-releasing system ATP-binding protein LolD n=1 Tax=Thalassoglobus polymorphus TaxID=2527994 RepID=A0A517QL49_9PLAN|nr:ABC transporter ATP-binding protein [Thalassoglobus polymorphus]QDT32346.1 Lipoprotein-releasing system ATP-binding protein LolD [Thalassoglobus polymorphus]
MYQLKEVTKTYTRRDETVTALDHSNLEIADNDFVAIVGPSGSGKTTMLSVLGGMMAPTSGQVILDGQSLYDLSVDERTAVRGKKIGFVFQAFNLIPYLSACENVQVPLLLSGKTLDEQRQRALEMLNRVGLADRVDHKPNELSQGQQQRVAMARTLANDPQIILADEPTGNLDSETRQQVMEYLTEFHQDGRTIVMVTHDRDSAAYAKRTVRLINGVATDANDARAA